MTKKNYDLSVRFQDLTNAQLIALVAFFEEWRRCCSIGTSPFVGFKVDGDGNFHPKIEMQHCELDDLGLTQEQFDELKSLAHVGDRANQRSCIPFDFDPVSWKLHDYL